MTVAVSLDVHRDGPVVVKVHDSSYTGPFCCPDGEFFDTLDELTDHLEDGCCATPDDEDDDEPQPPFRRGPRPPQRARVTTGRQATLGGDTEVRA